jgi:hypothetical protein
MPANFYVRNQSGSSTQVGHARSNEALFALLMAKARQRAFLQAAQLSFGLGLLQMYRVHTLPQGAIPRQKSVKNPAGAG